MSTIGASENDGQILQIANRLIGQFNIREYKPSSVTWAEYVVKGRGTYTGPHVNPIPIGWCEFTWGEVILPSELKGKLEPEEWKPLLASSLIYAAKLRGKKLAGIIARIAGTVLLEAILLAVLFTISPLQMAKALIPVIAGSVVLVMMGLPFVNSFLRSLRLQADRLAAVQVGTESLLATLRKVKSLNLESEDIGGRFSSRPALTERMRALEAQ